MPAVLFAARGHEAEDAKLHEEPSLGERRADAVERRARIALALVHDARLLSHDARQLLREVGGRCLG